MDSSVARIQMYGTVYEIIRDQMNKGRLLVRILLKDARTVPAISVDAEDAAGKFAVGGKVLLTLEAID